MPTLKRRSREAASSQPLQHPPYLKLPLIEHFNGLARQNLVKSLQEGVCLVLHTPLHTPVGH